MAFPTSNRKVHISAKELKGLYYKDFLSLTKIGKLFNVSKVAMRWWAKKYHLKMRTTKDYIGYLPSGKNHSNWKGGKWLNRGYVVLEVNGKHVFEHRLIMEKYLGRKLRKTEVVHHINGIKNDNRITNLIVMTRKKHSHEAVNLTKICQERIRFLEAQLRKEVSHVLPS